MNVSEKKKKCVSEYHLVDAIQNLQSGTMYAIGKKSHKPFFFLLYYIFTKNRPAEQWPIKQNVLFIVCIGMYLSLELLYMYSLIVTP